MRRALVRLGVTVFGAASGVFPRRFRARHGTEMSRAFEMELSRRLDAGIGRGVSYAVRASVDAVRQGITERRRRGGSPAGHDAPLPDGGDGMGKGVWTDVRLAWRAVRRSPGFALAATLVLGLGIGANTAVFSALRTAVLTPPPYPEAERLVLVDLTRRPRGGGVAEPMSWSFPKFTHYLDRDDRLVSPAVGYATRSATLTELGPAEMVGLEVVSPGYFEMLAREPVRGRGFTEDELTPDGSDTDVVVVSWTMWRERLGSDPAALDRSIVLNGVRLRIVGIAPRGFEGITGGAQLWIPMAATPSVFAPFMTESAATHWFYVLGRLTPGATVEEAARQMAAIGDGIAEAYPPPNSSRIYSGSVRSLADARSNPRARSTVIMLTAAALLVLAVACANLSSLMIARARRRSRDGAVRVAIGASRWRLVRASLVESLVLAGLGGALGVGLAVVGTRAMVTAWPSRFLRGEGGDLQVMDPTSIAVDTPALVFALAASIVTAAVFGVGPALRVSRSDPQEALRDGRRGRRRSSLPGSDARSLLVGAQVALALVLVVGTGLMAATTLRLLEVDEGFDVRDRVAFSYTIPASSPRIEDPVTFHEELVRRIEALPGVVSATFGCPPLRGHCIITRVDAVQGEAPIPPGEGLEIGARTVDEGHFEKLGIPLLRGRPFDDREGEDATAAVILNDFAARALFGGDDPIGRLIETGLGSDDKEDLVEVVGVVGDVLYSPPDRGIMAEAYFSHRDFPEHYGSITVRTVGDPLAAVPSMRATLTELDASIAMYRVETMEQLVDGSFGDRRATLWLLALFAAVTVLLAATGTWGVVSYAVADRRRELGLRLALGADTGRVKRAVVRHLIGAALAGLAVGTLMALLGSRLVESLLWGVEATDPVVYALAAALLSVVVGLASWLPARRVTRLDPVEALRAD